jgi:uncharacterized protein (DUF1684 family)
MGYLEDLARARAARDRFMAEHYASPLSDEEQAGFRGLDYYPPDERWRLDAVYDPADGERIAVPSSNGGQHPYALLGRVSVSIDGSSYELAVFDDGDGNPFIPFADATNGSDTYGGGRYVDLTIEDAGRAIVDFNDARNPYCAYDEEFVCPLPPSSNRIAARIEAGERTFLSAASSS